MKDFPKLRLELEGLKMQVIHAFTSYNQDVQDMVKQELENYLSTDNLKRLVRQTIKESVEWGVKAKIESYFKHGEGHHLIDETVAEGLKDWLKKNE